MGGMQGVAWRRQGVWCGARRVPMLEQGVRDGDTELRRAKRCLDQQRVRDGDTELRRAKRCPDQQRVRDGDTELRRAKRCPDQQRVEQAMRRSEEWAPPLPWSQSHLQQLLVHGGLGQEPRLRQLRRCLGQANAVARVSVPVAVPMVMVSAARTRGRHGGGKSAHRRG